MTCPFCFIEFEQKRTAGNPKKYCTRLCSERARHKRKKQFKTITKTCRKCSTTFATRKTRQAYCMDACRLADAANMTRQRYAKEKDAKFAAKYPKGYGEATCGWCGNIRQYDPRTQNPKGFHPECTKQARSASYRIKTVRRQKLSTPHRISHQQVVDLYGSDCHICKTAIDLTLPRTHKQGLTVDHFMPISKGGTDEMDNLRPAHWICNVRKRDKVITDA